MRKRSATKPVLLLLLGISAVLLIAWTLAEGRRTIDWAEEAQAYLEAKEYLPAYEAATRRLKIDPDNPEMLKLRADVATRLSMTNNALADYSAALRLDPGNPLLTNRRVALLMRLDRHEEAIEFIDQERVADPASTFLRLTAADARVSYIRNLTTRLTAILERHHPDRLHVRRLLRDHLRAATRDSTAKAVLLDGLSTTQLREDAGSRLDRDWDLVREADLLLGDLRSWSSGNAPAMMNRAQVDIYVGRLFRAKEELETALRITTLPETTVRRIQKQLADDVLLELGAHRARSDVYDQILANATNPAAAATAALEASWFAANEDPTRREAWRAAAAQQMQVTKDADLRIMAYRGLADLHWEPKDPDSAIRQLKTVFDALRLSNRLADPDLLVPERAERFIQGLLDAYHASGLLDAGLPVANALLDFSPDDPTLRRQRARILSGMKRHKESADDLMVGMRGTPRDRETFHEWLESASRVRDVSGKTPVEVAQDAVRRYRERIDAYTRQIDAAGDGKDFAQLVADRRQLREAAKSLGAFERSLATSAVVAWHMAEEFGRLGETELAQDFLLKAAWAEPQVAAFRFRLGQILLDLGKTVAAAHEFQSILERFPEDTEAALYAYGAWNQVGEIARARDIRDRAIAKSPLSAGLLFSARAALDRGDHSTARVLLTPYARGDEPIKLRWLGHARLLGGDPAGALRVLDAAGKIDPDDAEVALLRAVAEAIRGEATLFDAAARQFLNLPRLLPRARIDEALSLLEEHGAFLAAARLATGVAPRFAEGARLELLARGAMTALKTGDESGVLALVRPAELGDKIAKEAIHACFAVLLRDRGVIEAADWLKRAREAHRDDDRGFGTLTLAAAFSLASYQSEAQEYFIRYEQSHREGIPAEDAAVWWVLSQRIKRPGRGAAQLQPLPGNEAELQWLKGGGSSTAVEGQIVRPTGQGENVGDRLLYLQLVHFSDGVAADEKAREATRSVLNADRRAMFAARVLARRIEREEGAGPAGTVLLSRYQATPGDYPTFEKIGELLDGADSDATALMQALGDAGISLFPDREMPYLIRARAAALRGQPVLSAKNLRTLLEIQPNQELASERLAELLGKLKNEDHALFLAHLLTTRRTPPGPIAREFLSTRYAEQGRDAEAATVLTPILNRDPTFYSAAAKLVAVNQRRGAKQEVTRIAKIAIATLPTDPTADRSAAALADLCLELMRADRQDLALLVADAGLVAAPGSVRLRLRRVDLLGHLSRETESIEDLALLCALTPRDADVQFNFGEVLLTERTDLASGIREVLPTLAESAMEDPRYHELNGYLLYLSGDVAAAAEELAVAADGAPETPLCRYYEGLFRLLADQPQAARTAFAALPPKFEFKNRADWLAKLAAP